MTAVSGRKTCFLHLGPPKTGSSTISHFIEGNVPELDRLGYFVPQMPSLEARPQSGHGIFAHVAVDELDQDGRLKPDATLWPELEAVASEGARHIILTHESFAVLLREPEKLDLILKFFERHDYGVTVLAYLRDQPEWLNASYMQTQKRLSARQTFDEFVDASAERGRVDPWRFLETIIDNPRVRLEVGSYDAASRSGLEADFGRRIGLPSDAAMQPAPAVRKAHAGVKTVYAAQQILAATDGAIQEMGAYKKIYARFRKHFESRGWDNDPYVGLDQPDYERIRAFYRDSNDRFAKRFLDASWSELAPDQSFRKNVFDPAAATEEERDEISAVVEDIVTLIGKPKKRKGHRQQLNELLLGRKKR